MTPHFTTRSQFFKWYSEVYLHCNHWRFTVRPAVWRYRGGKCFICHKHIEGAYNVHHGKGMYGHLGEEQYYLDRMEVCHLACHQRYTKKERRLRFARKVRKYIIGI